VLKPQHRLSVNPEPDFEIRLRGWTQRNSWVKLIHQKHRVILSGKKGGISVVLVNGNLSREYYLLTVGVE
jgi:hypothetical protein